MGCVRIKCNFSLGRKVFSYWKQSIARLCYHIILRVFLKTKQNIPFLNELSCKTSLKVNEWNTSASSHAFCMLTFLTIHWNMSLTAHGVSPCYSLTIRCALDAYVRVSVTVCVVHHKEWRRAPETGGLQGPRRPTELCVMSMIMMRSELSRSMCLLYVFC